MKFRDPKTGSIHAHILCLRTLDGIDLPESVLSEGAQREIALAMGYEVISERRIVRDPFTLQTDAKKPDIPRICEILGVEVGEDFEIPNIAHLFGYDNDTLSCHVDEGGHLIDNESGQSFCSIVVDPINHPETIVRKPRFTDEEISILRHMAKAGIKWVSRDTDDGAALADMVYFWHQKPSWYIVNNGAKNYIGDEGLFKRLPAKLFTSIRPGDLINLDDLIKEYGEEAPY